MRPVGWNERGASLIEWELGARVCADLLVENTGHDSLTENTVRSRVARQTGNRLSSHIDQLFIVEELDGWFFLGEKVTYERGTSEILARVLVAPDKSEIDGHWYIPADIIIAVSDETGDRDDVG